LAGVGAIRYNGDVGKLRNKIIDPVEVINPYWKAGLCFRLSGHVETSLCFMHGTLEDADSLSDNADQLARNQSFKSPLDELSLQADVSLFDFAAGRRLNPYLLAGGGVFQFKPRARLNGAWHELQPLGTEGQYLNEAAYADPYDLTAYTYFFGGGVSFQLAPAWRLKLEAAWHATTTDFLDDVSTIYPDSAQLAAAPNGALAVQLSNRRLGSLFPPAGRSRGNPDSKDSYLRLGLTLVFNPAGAGAAGYGGGQKGKKNRRWRKAAGCPAFDS
jgi:hypothetical protein